MRSIFVTKTFIVGMLISVISVISSLFLISVADKILIRSIEEFADVSFYDLEIIKVIPRLLLADALLLVLVTVLTSFLTALVSRAIKPVEIIKAKE